MKKNLLVVSALALAVMSGSALAGENGGEIQFIGSVTTKTCDIVTDVNGATKDVVQLGTTTVNTSATPVDFSLKLADAAACDLTGLDDADFLFQSASLGVTGLANATGSATGAFATLSPQNATSTANITSGHQTVTVKTTDLKADGAQFQAQLTGGAVPGTYGSQVSFAVAYK